MLRSTRRWTASRHHGHLPSRDHSLPAPVNSNCLIIWISICILLSIFICICNNIMFDFVYVVLYAIFSYLYISVYSTCVFILIWLWHGRLWRVPFIAWAEDGHQVIFFFVIMIKSVRLWLRKFAKFDWDGQWPFLNKIVWFWPILPMSDQILTYFTNFESLLVIWNGLRVDPVKMS